MKFAELKEQFDDNKLENKTFVRSKELMFVKSNDGEKAVVYNRLLNSPVMIEKDGYEFIFMNEFIDLNKESVNGDDAAFFEQMVDNHIYLPEGVSEYDLIAQGVKNHMKMLQNGEYTSLLDLRISSACNFGCKHCIAATAQNNEFVRFEEAKKIIDEYYKFLSKRKKNEDIVLDVHFGIAEPLLAFDEIRKTVEYLDEAYPDIKKILSINTNLSLLTKEQAEFFRDHSVHIHVSIDGLGETNDMIRIYKDGSGTYHDIMSKINLLKEVGYPIFDIGVTLTDKNYESFKSESDKFLAWCKEYGITEIACEFDLINSITIQTQEKVDFLLDFVDRMAAEGISFDGTWSIPYLNLVNASYANAAFGFCRGASGINLSVDKNGMVYICSCSSKPICSIYKLEDELKPGGKFYKFVEKNLMGNIKECAGCDLEGCCVGQCRVTHEYHDTFDDKLKEQCAFYHLMTKRLLLREIQTY